MTGLVAGVCRVRRSEGSERVLIAALLAGFVAWLVAVGIDWIWELTAVAIVGVLLLGLLTGPATAQDGPKSVAELPRTTRRRFAVGVAAVLVVWTLIIAQAIPLLTHVKISASQKAVRAGNAERALGNAEDARRLQPWAASPYLQLALVREAIDDLPERPRGDRGRDRARPARLAPLARPRADRDELGRHRGGAREPVARQPP